MVSMWTRTANPRCDLMRRMAWVTLLLLAVVLVAPAVHVAFAGGHDHDLDECGLCQLFASGGPMLVPEPPDGPVVLAANGPCPVASTAPCGDPHVATLPTARAPPPSSW